MARPVKGRHVCCLPRNKRFGPLIQRGGMNAGETMTVDEFEAIRLIDYMNFTQEECARQMKVARTTVQGIYGQARRKLARSLVDGVPLIISGGSYELCGGRDDSGACRRGACPRHRQGRGEQPQEAGLPRRANTDTQKERNQR